MNFDEIQQKYGATMRRLTTELYDNGLVRLRDDANMDDAERTHKAWNLYDAARDLARQATEERNQQLAKREEQLTRSLFGAPNGFTVDASTKAAFTEALSRAATADDEGLERLAAAAKHTGDSTLWRATFTEAQRRERGDIAYEYLQAHERDRERYDELVNAPQSIPEPRFAQVAPTPQAQRRAQAQDARPLGG